MSRFYALGVVFGLLWALPIQSSSAAQDEVDGALWRFTISTVDGRKVSRTGLFRVKGNQIFQPRDGKASVVGTIDAKKFIPKKGDTIPVTFTDLRGSDGPPLQLKGRMIAGEPGDLTGRFKDSDDRRWFLQATGVKK